MHNYDNTTGTNILKLIQHYEDFEYYDGERTRTAVGWHN